MKHVLWLFFVGMFLMSCKKDKVDATTTRTLQSSINDMASGLNTLQQIKFNEALYILKTFGVEADGDINELKALGKLINGMKVPQIFALADATAQKHGIDWSSTGPPSLGEMNIFGSELAKESDQNDIAARSLTFTVTPIAVDSVLGPKSLQIVPRLLDAAGKPAVFSGAALETVLEVFSNGNKLLTSKNLMQNNDFKGFTLRFSSLPAQKISDNKIDITVSVKTTKKVFQMSKIGVAVNPKAVLMPAGAPDENPATLPDLDMPADLPGTTPDAAAPAPTPTPAPAPAADPKASVSRFLNSLNSQNLRAAYDASENPAWGSFENFSNPTSGFGGVKNVSVKNITPAATSANAASVNATYDVTDKNGKTTALQVTFGLKNVNGQWKISSYKIN